jgi:hypothetical protein
VPTDPTTNHPAPRSGGEVSVELPDHEPTRLPVAEAAARMVAAYGECARDHEITGRRAAFDAYWDEVERLLTQRETNDHS